MKASWNRRLAWVLLWSAAACTGVAGSAPGASLPDAEMDGEANSGGGNASDSGANASNGSETGGNTGDAGTGSSSASGSGSSSGHSGTNTGTSSSGSSTTGGLSDTLSISPALVQIAPGQTVQFVVGGASDVDWSVEGADPKGTVSPTGLYEAPDRSGTFHVTVISASDASMTATATVTVAEPAGTPPSLQPGVWTDITPADLDMSGTYGAPWVEVDPTNPRVLYLCTDMRGMWKSTDGGSSWNRLGDPNRARSARTAYYLDSPFAVRVDPRNSQRLVATQGVRGNTLGFWVSTDGGETWTMPAGFESQAPTADVTMFEPNPTDFDHILLSSHSQWGPNQAGLLETRDGGETWTLHDAQPGWNSATHSPHFLYDPLKGIGDSQTWLVSQEGGFWRTSDAGGSWTKVADFGITHGGQDLYYAADGSAYVGAFVYPMRSRDNGQTWERLDTLPYASYYAVHGDGTNLYTQLSFTGDNAGQGDRPYMVSSETDGTTWVPYQGGAQTFMNGPMTMRFDATNRIMYSANWLGGLWALRVLD